MLPNSAFAVERARPQLGRPEMTGELGFGCEEERFAAAHAFYQGMTMIAV